MIGTEGESRFFFEIHITKNIVEFFVYFPVEVFQIMWIMHAKFHPDRSNGCRVMRGDVNLRVEPSKPMQPL